MNINANEQKKTIDNSCAPIALFVFNRPDHTKKTIDSLKANFLAQESELYIFSDGPRSLNDLENVKEVRNIINDVDGFRKVTVYNKERNYGLAASVINGVSQLIEAYGKAIVVEDDLLLSPYFLSYMNESLKRYFNDPAVFSIGGYSPNIKIPETYTEHSYLSYRCCTWGWGTWKNRWEMVDWEVIDFDVFIRDQKQVDRFNLGGEDMTQILKMQMKGEVDSWGIRWDYAHFKNNAFCLRPTCSIVANIGMDGTGVHCAPSNHYDIKINNEKFCNYPPAGFLKVNETINRRFASFYDGKFRTEGKTKHWVFILNRLRAAYLSGRFLFGRLLSKLEIR